MYEDISNNCGNMIPEEQQNTTKFIQNVSYNFFDIANAAGKFAKNPRSKTALQFFFEKLKGLEKEWYEFGVKYEQMQRQNENLIHDCERERNKSKVYQKRLKFVKENQRNYEQLREVYMNKRNTPRDTWDSGCQTMKIESDRISVERDTINCAKNALNQIKTLVDVRENRYEDNFNKIIKLINEISTLEAENRKLNEMISSKYIQEKSSLPHNDNETAKMEALHKKTNEQHIENNVSESAKKDELVSKRTDEVKQNGKKNFKRQLNNIHVPTVVKANNHLTNNLRSEDNNESCESEIPLNAIKSIRTQLASSLGLIPRASELKSINSNGEKNMNKGDCKEVNILKRLQVEIEKRQNSLKDKIDKFNLFIDK